MSKPTTIVCRADQLDSARQVVDSVALRQSVLSAPTVEDKLAALKGAHAGKSCWLLACGPSILNKDLSMLPADQPVLTVKQALDLYPAADFHLLNHVFRKEYTYQPNTISLGYTETLPVDIAMPFLRSKGSLCSRKDFDAWMLDKQALRTYGPGVVYEIAFPLVVHLGCTRVTTIGFDCEPGDYRHFYNTHVTVRHEAHEIREAMPDWREWLKSKGVEWTKL